MVPRLLLRIALLSVAGPVLATFTLAQRPQGRSDEVVGVNTELVQTDFMVFDKEGNFVDGLKPAQFVLKVEGKAREITFFDRIAAGSRNEEAQLAAARGNPTNTGGKSAAVPLDRGRTVMFFLDDMHLSNGSMSQVRAMLKRFVEREMRQNDQSVIASATGQLGFLQQLTDNREVMKAAIDRLRTQPSLLLQSAERPPMTEYQALAIDEKRRDCRVLDDGGDQCLQSGRRFDLPEDLPRKRSRPTRGDHHEQLRRRRGFAFARRNCDPWLFQQCGGHALIPRGEHRSMFMAPQTDAHRRRPTPYITIG
jgi:VWFA-related protein